MKKMRVLYFLELLKFQKKSGLTFFIAGLYIEILTICAFGQSMNLTEITSKENICFMKLTQSVDTKYQKKSYVSPFRMLPMNFNLI